MCEPVSGSAAAAMIAASLATTTASIIAQRQLAKKQEAAQQSAIDQQNAYQAKLDNDAKAAKAQLDKDAFETDIINTTKDSTSFQAQEEARKKRQGIASTQASKIYGNQDEVSTLKKTLGGF